MESIQHIPVPAPGARGVDRRSDESDLDSMAALGLDNVDLIPAGPRARLRPRAWFRCYGWRGVRCLLTVEDDAEATLNGTYYYVLKWNDGERDYWSSTETAVVTTGHKVVVHWFVTTGTLTIARSVNPGDTIMQVMVTLDSESTPPISQGYYDDDGSVTPSGGIVDPRDCPVEPFGNNDFTQTVLIDYLFVHYSRDETTRILSGLARTAGVGSTALGIWNYPDKDEFWYQLTASTGSPDDPIQYTKLGDRVWAAVPGSSLKYGYSSPSSSATQPTSPSISNVTEINVGAGNLDPATGYQWVVQAETIATGIRGVPSEPYPSSPWTPGTPPSDARLTFSGGSSGTSYRYHVYRITDGGQYFQYVGYCAGTASTYDDDTIDVSLGLETVPYEVGAASGFKCIMEHCGQLFVGNKQSAPKAASLVRWTSALLPFNFPDDALSGPEHEFQVAGEDGDELEAMYSWGQLGLLFKRRRVFLLLGNPPTNFTYRLLEGSAGLGCAGWRTIRDTPVGLFYLSPSGVAWIPAPGAPPQIVSDEIEDVFVEPQRTAALAAEEPSYTFAYDNLDAVKESFHFHIQFASDSEFSSVVADYDSTEAGERDAFRVGGEQIPAGGVEISAGGTVMVTVTPEGLTGGATYYVRAKAYDGLEWSEWAVLSTFTEPYDDLYGDVINWERAAWAFAVHYAPREEYWLWIPTGNRAWCDVAWILSYSAMKKGGPPIWRRAVVAATAGCLLPDLQVGDARPQTYMLIAGPDGLAYIYPYLVDGYDYDARVPVATRIAEATRTVPPAAGTELTNPMLRRGEGRGGRVVQRADPGQHGDHAGRGLAGRALSTGRHLLDRDRRVGHAHRAGLAAARRRLRTRGGGPTGGPPHRWSHRAGLPGGARQPERQPAGDRRPQPAGGGVSRRAPRAGAAPDRHPRPRAPVAGAGLPARAAVGVAGVRAGNRGAGSANVRFNGDLSRVLEQ